MKTINTLDLIKDKHLKPIVGGNLTIEGSIGFGKYVRNFSIDTQLPDTLQSKVNAILKAIDKRSKLLSNLKART